MVHPFMTFNLLYMWSVFFIYKLTYFALSFIFDKAHEICLLVFPSDSILDLLPFHCLIDLHFNNIR